MGGMIIRPATADDLPHIVALLTDDAIGSGRETDAGEPAYRHAFDEITADPRQRLVVGEHDGQVVATLQLTLIPGLSRRGARRALIEAVRVRADQRNAGLGRELLTWAIEQARAEGCALVQLTSDARRVDARRFYVSLGFEPSHVGFKMLL